MGCGPSCPLGCSSVEQHVKNGSIYSGTYSRVRPPRRATSTTRHPLIPSPITATCVNCNVTGCHGCKNPSKKEVMTNSCRKDVTNASKRRKLCKATEVTSSSKNKNFLVAPGTNSIQRRRNNASRASRRSTKNGSFDRSTCSTCSRDGQSTDVAPFERQQHSRRSVSSPIAHQAAKMSKIDRARRYRTVGGPGSAQRRTSVSDDVPSLRSVSRAVSSAELLRHSTGLVTLQSSYGTLRSSRRSRVLGTAQKTASPSPQPHSLVIAGNDHRRSSISGGMSLRKSKSFSAMANGLVDLSSSSSSINKKSPSFVDVNNKTRETDKGTKRSQSIRSEKIKSWGDVGTFMRDFCDHDEFENGGDDCGRCSRSTSFRGCDDEEEDGLPDNGLDSDQESVIRCVQLERCRFRKKKK